MEENMVPWTVIYKMQQKSEILSRVMIAPMGGAEAWAHCQHLTEGGVILALLKGSHEALTGHMPDGQAGVKVTERELLTPNDPNGW
jgi:hypothetical protein